MRTRRPKPVQGEAAPKQAVQSAREWLSARLEGYSVRRSLIKIDDAEQIMCRCDAAEAELTDCRYALDQLRDEQSQGEQYVVNLKAELAQARERIKELEGALEQVATIYENPEPPSLNAAIHRAYDMRCIARAALTTNPTDQ
jgi:chromosome segregation ATPase